MSDSETKLANLFLRWKLKSQGINEKTGEKDPKGASGANEFSKIWKFLKKRKEVEVEEEVFKIEKYECILENGSMKGKKIKVMKGLPYFKNTFIMKLPYGGRRDGTKDYDDFVPGKTVKAKIHDDLKVNITISEESYFRRDGELRIVDLAFHVNN